ncbi:MAG: hypothetical protein MUF42_06450 [Cytophagaceae bacterium]|jgi:hypothetical protein|nr:hypothetical protein [Cytophagaceae bacterium]
MNTKHPISEEIDRYLRGQMNDEERKALEKRISTDADLQYEFALQSAAEEALYTWRLHGLKERMQQDLRASGKPGWYWYLIGLAALGCLFVVLTFSWKRTHPQETGVPTYPQEPKVSVDTLDSSNQRIVVNTTSNTTLYNRPKEPASPVASPTTEVNSAVPLQEAKTTPEYNINTQPERLPDPSTMPEKCPPNSIQFDFHAIESCENTSEGKIKLYRIKGGKSPYIYWLNSQKSSIPEFSFLAPGSYELKVEDNEGCRSIETIIIPAKACRQELHQAFQPEFESWKYAESISEACTLNVYNQSGRLVKQLWFQEGEEVAWDGRDMQGSFCEPGYYAFTINYEKKSANSGYITIMK